MRIVSVYIGDEIVFAEIDSIQVEEMELSAVSLSL